jgi:hypothetical protein
MHRVEERIEAWVVELTEAMAPYYHVEIERGWLGRKVLLNLVNQGTGEVLERRPFLRIDRHGRIRSLTGRVLRKL